MGSIKLNLPSGVVVEKKLINAFKADEITYFVLDAESVGSMGLPIIMVCKIDNNRTIKISDADEWAKVKGFLKEIISGTRKGFVKISENMAADEIYYTQLTLPVASFDALKNIYVQEINLEDVSNVNVVTQETVEPTPVSTVDNDIIAPNNDDLNGVVNMSIENDIADNNILSDVSLGEKEATNNVNVDINNNPVQNEDNSLPDISVENYSEAIPQNGAANDVVANPLLDENVMPESTLITNENQPLENNVDSVVEPNVTSNNSVDNNGQVMPEVSQNVVEDIVPMSISGEKNDNDDFAKEKEEFLKFWEQFFDKMIDKIKNN